MREPAIHPSPFLRRKQATIAQDFYTYVDVKFEKKHNFPEHDLDQIFADTFGEGKFTRSRAEFVSHLEAASGNKCDAAQLG